MNLSDYLDSATRRRWQWGFVDCTLFCGDWAMTRSGRDPGEGIRGTYSTEGEALAIVEGAGGMVAFVGDRLEAIGWERLSFVNHPQEGDIGVVRAPVVPLGHTALVPGIFGSEAWGNRWITRGMLGLTAGRFPHRAVWRFPQ